MRQIKFNPTGAQKPRVFIVDDHPTVRRGLHALFRLETDLMICGEAAGATDAWMKISALQPEAIVVDLTLREGDGVELIKRLRRAFPNLVILAFTMHNEQAYVERALKAGADDVVLKEQGAELLIKVIRAFLRGKTGATKAAGSIGAADFSTPAIERLAASNHQLKHREVEVLYLLGQGGSPSEIARRLRISPRAVDACRKHIQRELGLTDDPAALARYARRLVRSRAAA